VVIPVNTSAVIHIPTTAVASLRLDGKPWKGQPLSEDGYAVVDVGSGHYHFSAEHSQSAVSAAGKSR
jgi:hypothetical protein